MIARLVEPVVGRISCWHPTLEYAIWRQLRGDIARTRAARLGHALTSFVTGSLGNYDYVTHSSFRLYVVQLFDELGELRLHGVGVSA
jgi:hypothetical protein